MFYISKTFRWEMGHKLVKSYTCGCMNIHGHSYKAKIVLRGSKLKQGVVVDFKELKDAVIKRLEFQLDHVLLLDARDDLVKVLEKHGDDFKDCLNDIGSIKLFSAEPTAENIAAYIYQETSKWISHRFDDLDSVQIDSVTVYETETSSAKRTSPISDEIYIKELYE